MSSIEPDDSCHKVNATQERISSFVVPRRDATVLLQASKEVLDEVALFVQVLVIATFFFAVPTTWDDYLFSLLQERVHDPLLRVIAFVGKNCSSGNGCKQHISTFEV